MGPLRGIYGKVPSQTTEKGLAMADKTEQTPWRGDRSESDESADRTGTAGNRDITGSTDAPGTGPGADTDQDLEARRAQDAADEMAAIDETEISTRYQTTTLARRAHARFDPRATRPQLAEHWQLTPDRFEGDEYY